MDRPPLHTFASLPADASRTVTWIHLGDLHMTRGEKQNACDLGDIVDEINEVFAKGGVDFVFVPGDIADDGSVTAYELVRAELDRLQIPWCGIVGDHDVHEKSFANFKRYIATDLYSAFSVGSYRFLRLNAFSEPRPDSFLVDDAQLAWLESELQACERDGSRAIVLLHCYPTDLKGGGGGRLTALLHRYPVLLVDMGHTHYNEISNDGTLLYSATRSTGQIEEGPVGYSVITLDGTAVSWEFVPLRAGSRNRGLVQITHPSDRRLRTARTGDATDREEFALCAKVWLQEDIASVTASLDGTEVLLQHQSSAVWSGVMRAPDATDGAHALHVTALDDEGRETRSTIEVRFGPEPERTYAERDQDNAIGAWEERGLLGTQLGPNKNGRKW